MTIETANRLVEYRKGRNLSQEEVAERIGVSRQAVSKWERAEASPDTDNLIALADLYEISLDELIRGNVSGETGDSGRITVTKGDKTVVVIEPTPDGHRFGSESGMHIHVNDDGEDDEQDEEDKEGRGHKFHGEFTLEHDSPRSDVHRFFQKLPFPVLTAIAYLCFGVFGVCGGWAYGWVIFCSVPVYYSLVEAIFLRKPGKFAYPVLVTWAYLWCGFAYGLWHPLWILFITVPIYYFFAEFLGKLLCRK